MTYAFTRNAHNGIVRETVAIDVADMGTVHFERPSMWHLGRKVWHVDFSFSANGRDYWGMLWNNGEIEISTHGRDRTTRRLPETHKRDWRAALAQVGAPIIRASKQERAAFVDAGDFDNADRVAIGNAPKVAPVQSDEPASVPAPNAIDTIRDCVASLEYAVTALQAPSFSTIRANLAELKALLVTVENSTIIRAAFDNESAMHAWEDDGELDTSHKRHNGCSYRDYRGQGEG